MHHVNAAHPARRSEAGHVTNHPATQRIDAGIAGGTQGGQCVDHTAEIGQRFFRFAGINDMACNTQVGLRGAQRGFYALGIQRRYIGIADDQCVPATQGGGEQRAII